MSPTGPANLICAMMDENQRYARHHTLPGFGAAGQLRLRQACVAVVGAGGLGCPALQYLAAAGVGALKLMDPDRVEATNLHRQILFAASDIGRHKAEVAAERLAALNPATRLEATVGTLASANIFEWLAGCDVVLDGSDNFATRYLVNDACCALGLPLVSASVFRWEGQLAVFNAPLADGTRSAQLRDLFPEPPTQAMDCSTGGVLGTLPGILGALQATEAIKLVAKVGRPLTNRLWVLDAFGGTLQMLRYAPTNPPEAPEAWRHRLKSTDYSACDAACGAHVAEVRVSDIAQWFANRPAAQWLDVREADERAAGRLPGLHIPLGELARRLGEIPQRCPVLAYCAGGSRSQKAAELLKAHGYEAYSLQGGLAAYEASAT